ncbi:unnamed protein product [Ectocarpus fasciculatus]
MEIEPSQLIKGMDVDIGMGLGDDLGGFEGFDAMFAEPNSTSDFFKFCEIEDTQQQQHQQDMAITNSAFQGPPSPASTFGHQPKVSDFGQESWASGGQQLQIQAWPLTTTLSSSAPTQQHLNPNLLLPSGGKPRARKRHDEDEALVSKESVFPVIKRRSSTASMSTNNPSPPPSSQQEGLEKSHSFCVTTPGSGGWVPAVSQQQQGVARHGGNRQPPPPQQQQQQQGGMASPPGGAIKVNTDVTSGNMPPPRISVFMSNARRRGASGGSSRQAATPASSPSMMPSAPGSYSSSALEPTMDRTASAQAQRLKDLRITMRGRSVAEKYVVDHNPAVVAMGSPPHHPNSTSALLFAEDDQDDDFTAATAAVSAATAVPTAPTLRRASSVGALTIAGSGEVLSTSPVLSSTGRIIQSCELSDRVGDAGQRRNLVCKVFGSGGSPFLRPASGGR